MLALLIWRWYSQSITYIGLPARAVNETEGAVGLCREGYEEICSRFSPAVAYNPPYACKVNLAAVDTQSMNAAPSQSVCITSGC
jgi:hypothetical protein